MDRITTRKDLIRWVTDRYGDQPPTEQDIDRIKKYLDMMGFKWGDTIGEYDDDGCIWYLGDIPDDIFWGV